MPWTAVAALLAGFVMVMAGLALWPILGPAAVIVVPVALFAGFLIFALVGHHSDG